MSPQRTGIRLALTLAVCAVLAACAIQPPRQPSPSPMPAVVTPIPKVPAPPVAPAPAPKPSDQPWTGIVGSDVMQDCADSPLIHANALMYTRSPAHFEELLKHSLPLIIYVHDQLQDAGIPGEFSMLPMLESSYDPGERGHRNGPAGLWQFIPGTARRHGVAVNKRYDGRLDPVASTRAAIQMLKALHEQFGDWRLVAMAYNAGPAAVTGALHARPHATAKPVPDLPLGHTTRTHLARMMALSCILREPERFHVQLPQPSANTELAAVKVAVGTRLKKAAAMAEMPESKLRALNPGYLVARVTADSSRTLLLPANAARSLAAALTVDDSESVAQVNAESNSDPADNIPLPDEPSPPQDDTGPATAAPAPRSHHRVREGETLWSIAQHYHVSVRDLKRWNDLRGDMLRPGEELRVRG